MAKYTVFWLAFVFILFFPKSVYAASDYVLPYPSFMPGSTFYKIHSVYEKVAKYWYFGDFGQFTYNQKETDLYLVQSKTLFEYDQFLLGYQALQKSDSYFAQLKPGLIQARDHKKPVSEKEKMLTSETRKHIEVLEKLLFVLPQTIVWSPEKQMSQTLNLKEAIKKSISIRKLVL